MRRGKIQFDNWQLATNKKFRFGFDDSCFYNTVRTIIHNPRYAPQSHPLHYPQLINHPTHSTLSIPYLPVPHDPIPTPHQPPRPNQSPTPSIRRQTHDRLHPKNSPYRRRPRTLRRHLWDLDAPDELLGL